MNDKPTERESKFFIVSMVMVLTFLLTLAVMQSLGLFGQMVLSFGG